ncbi:hypothetical protein Scep_018596 [Stephania cephalantha]|uniref:Uncharacterized protein n=1 Tax=Stephania cephalantha TaxID=152367 RepID=A0AAP0I9A0_9MAGN
MGVEGGRRENDLREAGGKAESVVEGNAWAVGDAMKGLRPPLVGGDAESGDGGAEVCRAASGQGRRRSATFSEHFGDSPISSCRDFVAKLAWSHANGGSFAKQKKMNNNNKKKNVEKMVSALSSAMVWWVNQ